MDAVATIERPEASLKIFDSITPGHIVYASIKGEAAPLIQAGEVAVIDIDDQLPTDGGLFLIEHIVRRSGALGPESRECEMVRIVRRERRDLVRGDVVEWWTRVPRAARPGEFLAMDGPYADEYALMEKILGRVVGIYHPGARTM